MLGAIVGRTPGMEEFPRDLASSFLRALEAARNRVHQEKLQKQRTGSMMEQILMEHSMRRQDTENERLYRMGLHDQALREQLESESRQESRQVAGEERAEQRVIRGEKRVQKRKEEGAGYWGEPELDEDTGYTVTKKTDSQGRVIDIKFTKPSQTSTEKTASLKAKWAQVYAMNPDKVPEHIKRMFGWDKDPLLNQARQIVMADEKNKLKRESTSPDVLARKIMAVRDSLEQMSKGRGGSATGEGTIMPGGQKAIGGIPKTGQNVPRQKGPGYFGTLQRPGGGVSTEISIGVNLNGKETEIPLLVPTLTDSEKQWLLTHKGSPKDVPTTIVNKAIAYAKKRISAGQSPFAQAGENMSEVDRLIDEALGRRQSFIPLQ